MNVEALSAEVLDQVKVTQPFKLNNVALKWLRDTHEHPLGLPTVETVELTDADPLDIGVLEKKAWNGLQLQGRGRENSMVMEANVGRYECWRQGPRLGAQSSFRRRPRSLRARAWKL